MIDFDAWMWACLFVGGIYRYRTYYRLGNSLSTDTSTAGDIRILGDAASPVSIRVDASGNTRTLVL